MPPRSARKRRNSEAQAATPSRRRKREDTSAAEPPQEETKTDVVFTPPSHPSLDPPSDTHDEFSLSLAPEDSQMLMEVLESASMESHDAESPREQDTPENSLLADAISDENHEAPEAADDEHDSRDSLGEASASIEELLQQLVDVASNFMTEYRELVVDGEVIQAELEQLDCEQEARCEGMIDRLQRAGTSIFSFGQTQDEAVMASQDMAVQ